ncbi:serine/threonine-protein kinase/endoribonuclease IRE1a-like protein [Tanacetum coccineum]
MVVARYRSDTLMASSSIDNFKSLHDFNNITTTTNYTNTSGQVGANGFKRVDITAEEEGKWNLKYTYFTTKYFKDARRVELSVGNLLENTQRIYHEAYDGMDCYMKRVHVTTMGYDHFHLKLLKSYNEQSNMLRIYDARCDSLHYEIAIEKCSMNLDEFIRRKTKDRRELLRMFREIIRGIIHIHDNGIAYCAISPHNIVVKTYGSIEDVPKLCK